MRVSRTCARAGLGAGGEALFRAPAHSEKIPGLPYRCAPRNGDLGQIFLPLRLMKRVIRRWLSRLTRPCKKAQRSSPRTGRRLARVFCHEAHYRRSCVGKFLFRHLAPVSLRTGGARIIQLLRELPVGVAIGEILWEAAHKLLRSGAVVSYSQFAELHIAKGFFDINRPGFYIDVGCNHPMWNSNTYELYLRGWSGLAIDANPACTREFSRWRPRDRVITAALAAEPGTAILNIERSSLMSSLSADFVAAMVPPGDITARVEVQTVRLGDVLAQEQVPARFELMSIDVEGMDDIVLRSFDIERFRPTVVLVELHGIDLANASKHPCVAYLRDHGYTLVSLCRFTGVFLYCAERPSDGTG